MESFELNPQKFEDFERILLYQPNNSAIWIGYMAYYLRLNELSKAREIAERGLKNVNFREEKEKTNLWIAYLNMECAYGNLVEDVFKRAIQYNDAKKMYLQMIYIYEKNSMRKQAKELCDKASEKFYYSKKVWLRYMEFLYKESSSIEEARQILLKAMKKVNKKKHIFLITNAARLEYKFASPERGQTYYEKLLSEHPKRSDLWLQFLDVHINANTTPAVKQTNFANIRNVFEKIVSLQFKPRIMKLFFTRWLSFERTQGTPQDEEYVQQKAREYVEKVEAQKNE